MCVHGGDRIDSGGGLGLADVRVAEQELSAEVALFDVVHVRHVHLAFPPACLDVYKKVKVREEEMTFKEGRRGLWWIQAGATRCSIENQ